MYPCCQETREAGWRGEGSRKRRRGTAQEEEITSEKSSECVLY